MFRARAIQYLRTAKLYGEPPALVNAHQSARSRSYGNSRPGIFDSCFQAASLNQRSSFKIVGYRLDRVILRSFSGVRYETVASAERAADAALWRRRMEQRRRRQFYSVLFGIATAAVLVFSGLKTIESSLIFFYTPTQALEQSPPVAPDKRVRLGGLVVNGSLQRLGNGNIEFELTDLENEVSVTYRGILPDLFREGQSAVVEGFLVERGDGERIPRFEAISVLAKHDEKYMPAEVRRIIEKNK